MSALEYEIERLKAENKQLKLERDGYKAIIDNPVDYGFLFVSKDAHTQTVNELNLTIAGLKSNLERLKNALKPFAYIYAKFTEGYGNSIKNFIMLAYTEISIYRYFEYAHELLFHMPDDYPENINKSED